MSRPYGWNDDGTLNKTEARELRKMAKKIIAGAPLRQVVNDLIARDVATVSGGQWASVTVKRALTNPRMIGQRELAGRLVDAGTPAILDPDIWQQVRDILTDPDRKRFAPKKKPKYLLSGFARCSRCGRALHARGPQYACETRYGGCTGVTITVDLADHEVAARVLDRVSDAKWRRALQRALVHPPEYWQEKADRSRVRLVELAEAFGAGDDRVDRPALEAGRDAAVKAIERADAQAAMASAANILPDLSTEDVVEWWEGASIDTRREVVGLVLDHVTVTPAVRGETISDRLQFTWK